MDGSKSLRESASAGASKFWLYAKNALLQSTIAGVPQIVGAENIPKKLIRLLVFVSSIVGFTYQFGTFMYLYWEYPIIMDVQVTSPLEIDAPAFTICDHNGLSLSKYCLEQRCYNPAPQRKTICKTLRRYCRRGLVVDTVRFPEDYETTLETIRASQVNRSLLRPDLEEKINMCVMMNARSSGVTECDKHPHTPFISGFLPTSTDCQSYSVMWEKPGEEPEKISSAANIDLILKVNGRDYLPTIPEKYVSYYMEFHDPYSMINPFLTGSNIFKGRAYQFSMKQRVLKLLPPPFTTNCMDYMEAWQRNEGTGPGSQPECIEECKMRMEFEELGCNSYYIWYPTDNPRCKSGCKNETCPEGFPVNPKLQDYSDECAKKCRPACLQKQYEVIAEEMQVSEDVFSHIPDWRTWKNYIYIRASFSKHEITTYTYSPKFEVIETFSYLGGYIGMWLGISLVAIFDLTETIIAVGKYQWRRMNRKRGSKNSKRRHLHVV